MQLKSRTITTAAIADHSARSALTTYADGAGTTDGGIKVPGASGQMFTLREIKITMKGALATVVNSGGKFEFENDSIDWKPLEFYSNTVSGVGAAIGAYMSPTKIPVNVPLPAGSITYVYYTANAANIDKPYVTLVWSETPFGGAQTFSKSSIGTAITQITKAVGHCSVVIPSQKNGRVQAIFTQVYGTAETIVVGGGLVEVHNTSISGIETTQWCTGGLTCVTAGGSQQDLEVVPNDLPAPGGSTFTFDYTPTDNQSQQLAVMVVWTS
jgi:hypothetical protein